MNKALTIPCALLLAASLSADGQSREETATGEAPPVARYEVSRATSEIRIDGVLDDPAWADALVIELAYEWSPGDNVEPPVATECLVTYDDDNLYVAFRALDPEPAKIRAHLMDRDDVGTFIQDDHVGFTIDPFNDERRGFQFRVNPLGVQVDAVFNEITQLEDFSWDIIWSSAASIIAEGYVAEIAVPLNQIRFPRGGKRQTWGIDAFRSYPRNFRYRISSRYTDRDKDCTLCQENKISGFEGIRPGLNLELDPTLTGLRTDALDAFPQGDLEKVDEDTELGLSLRWGFTPNLALNAAINPDFSQVEADVAQLDVNVRFALFFPEKRPFFLEGADFFETPIEAIFTRTIFDPNWGLKVTGKEGRNALGIVLAEDDFNSLTIPFNQFSGAAAVDEEVLNGIIRYRRDIGARSTLGLLYTGRSGEGDYRNQVYGVDGFFRFTTSDRVSFQYLHSDTEYPRQIAERFGQAFGEFGDDAYALSYDHLSRNWIATVSYEDLGEDFRADSGFLPRVDLRTGEAILQHRLWGTGDDWYTLMAFGGRYLRSEDQAGRLTDETYEVAAFWAGAKQSSVELVYSTNKEFFNGILFDLDRGTGTFQIRPTGALSFLLGVQSGDAIDFTNTQKGDELVLAPRVEVKLGKHVNLQLDHIRQTLDVTGGELFDAQLSQMRLVYQLNVRTFVRLITQLTRVDQNTELYTVPVEPKVEELFNQLLFSYKVNPRTVLFAGYTETRFGLADVSLTQTDRTFFLKLGYAFLF